MFFSMIYFFLKKHYIFFQKKITNFFSNFELIGNLALLFKKKTLSINTMFSYMIFFPKMILLVFFHIELVEDLVL